MHIVIILDHAHINGGQAKVALESALGLKARGHQITVFAAVGPIDPRLSAAGINVICLDQNDVHKATSKISFAFQAMWNTPAATALKTFLASCPSETTLVHVHGWAKALSPSIGPVLAQCGLSVVYTMHEFFLVCPNGGFYDYQRQTPCHLTPMSMACLSRNCDLRSYPRKIWRALRHGLLDHVSKMKPAIEHLITISDLQTEVSRPYIPEDVVWHRVDNPISVPELGPKMSSLPGPFLFVGRLSPEKGIHLFLEAARKTGVTVQIVGDGPSADELKTRYPEADFLGWKSPEDVMNLMRKARALVFPSVWYEGQPLTVYEALAVGTPVIVSDVCAGREAIENGVNGYWFASQSADSLAEKMRLLLDEAFAKTLSETTYRKYWSKPLTLERHLDALEGVYMKAFDSKGRTLSAA